MYGVRQIQDGYTPPYPQQPQYPQQQYPQQAAQPQAQAPATGANARNLPYAIQVAAVTKPASMGSSDFIRIKQLFNLDVYEVYSNGIYRYYAGGFSTIEEAKAMCDRVNRGLGKSDNDKFFAKKK
jgi:hypothetical protein